MAWLFNLIFYHPLYNALVALTDLLPGGNIGWAVVILTIVVRLILFPLQHRMTHTQRKLKQLEPTIKELKTKHADDAAAHGQALMALYREHGINPFSGVLLLIIQIPLLLALYWVFRSGFNFDAKQLYSFVHLPAASNPLFLNLIDLTKRSVALGVLAGLTQFGQLQLAQPPAADGQFAKSLSTQMRFTLPVMIAIFSLGLPAAIPLYWVTSNLFGIGHELYVRRQATKLLKVS